MAEGQSVGRKRGRRERQRRTVVWEETWHEETERHNSFKTVTRRPVPELQWDNVMKQMEGIREAQDERDQHPGRATLVTTQVLN